MNTIDTNTNIGGMLSLDELRVKREKLIAEMELEGFIYDSTLHPDHIDWICRGCFRRKDSERMIQ